MTPLDKMIEPSRQQRPQSRPHPVNPVVDLEIRARDARAERARRVDGGAGVVDAGDFDDEEGEADADGGDEGVFGFLGGEHEDCEDELGGEELWGWEISVESLGAL